jgi:tartrate-resistant acid phosphatase type 5
MLRAMQHRKCSAFSSYWLPLVLALASGSCGKDDADATMPITDDDDSPVPGDDAGGGDTDMSGDGDGDGDGDIAGDGDGDNDAGQPHGAVRFLVLGDGGTGDAAQMKTAAAMKTVCAEKGCDFALYLGDNIYENGVDGIDDAQFMAKFETPFAELDFPFHVALGNHDYGGNGTNLFSFATPAANVMAQLEYTGHSDKWDLPMPYYTFREGDVQFFVLDSNSVVMPESPDIPLTNKGEPLAPLAEQKAWLDAQLASSDARWKIVMAHHPYISNGEHGNAGAYAASVLGFSEAPGTAYKGLIDDSVCGKAQVYFSGHDHDREWLEPTCGTQFIVSGATAKLRDLPGHDSPSRWSDGAKNGFLWVEIEDGTMTGVFYDSDANVDYTDTVTL